MNDRHAKHIVHYLCHGALLFVTALVLIFMLIASSSVFIKGVIEEEKHNLDNSSLDSLRLELLHNQGKIYEESKDTILLAKTLQNFEKRICVLERQNETALSDIRQETNNIINKVNGWIGFWIAVLAIFGAIIPIVIQYILREKSKKEVEDLFEKAKEKATNCQLQMLVSSMYVNHQFSLIADSSKQNEFLKLINRRAHDSFCQLYEMVKNNGDELSGDDETHLINALMQYSQLVEILLLKTPTRRNRGLKKVLDRIKRLIVDIMDHEHHSRREIINRLSDLLPSLSSLVTVEE